MNNKAGQAGIALFRKRGNRAIACAAGGGAIGISIASSIGLPPLHCAFALALALGLFGFMATRP